MVPYMKPGGVQACCMEVVRREQGDKIISTKGVSGKIIKKLKGR